MVSVPENTRSILVTLTNCNLDNRCLIRFSIRAMVSICFAMNF